MSRSLLNPPDPRQIDALLARYVLLDTGDGVQLSDGAITATDKTLTSATAAWKSADVGKLIAVQGADTDDYDLVTTIASINSATSIELTDAAVETVSDAMVVYGTDQTDALEDAIEEATAAGKTLAIAPGIYLINGALQTGSNYNCQVRLPTYGPGERYVAHMVGASAPPHAYYQRGTEAAPAEVPHSRGTIIMSLLRSVSGTRPAMIGGPQTVADTRNNLNHLQVTIQDITFRALNDPQPDLLDLYNCGNSQIDRVRCDTWVRKPDQLEPTRSAQKGLWLPKDANMVCGSTNQFTASGHYTGIHISEHAHGDHLYLQACKVGLEVETTWHAMIFDRVLVQRCPIWLKCVIGPRSLTNAFVKLNLIGEAGGEESATWHNTHTYHIDDSNNYLRGKIAFQSLDQTGTSLVDQELVLNGATNVYLAPLMSTGLTPLDTGGTSNVTITTHGGGTSDLNWNDVGLSIDLPGAGDWLVTYMVNMRINGLSGTTDVLARARLYDDTASALVSDSYAMIISAAGRTGGLIDSATKTVKYRVLKPSTIKLQIDGEIVSGTISNMLVLNHASYGSTVLSAIPAGGL